MATPSRFIPRLLRSSSPSRLKPLLPRPSIISTSSKPGTSRFLPSASLRQRWHSGAVRREFREEDEVGTSPMVPAAEAPGSMSPSVAAAPLTPTQYDRVSDLTMNRLTEHLEALVEEYSPEGEMVWEVEYSSGVLTLSLGPHGTYVINKQPPNQQIWLSSPFSGPMRFNYVPPSPTSPTSSAPPTATATTSDLPLEEGHWFYPRDEVTLGQLLDREIRSVVVGEVGEEEGGSGLGWGFCDALL